MNDSMGAVLIALGALVCMGALLGGLLWWSLRRTGGARDDSWPRQ